MKMVRRIVAMSLAIILTLAGAIGQYGILTKAADVNEMTIAFTEVNGTELVLDGTLANGSTLMATYQDWRNADGKIKLGKYNAQDQIEYTEYDKTYSIVTDGDNQIIGYGWMASDVVAIQIDAGTTLTLWAQGSRSTTPIKITNSIRYVKNASGVWEDRTAELEPSAPTEMTLSFQSVDSGNNWYFGGANTDGTYYRVPVIVDGAAQNMIMESNKAGTFTVWNGFFHALQGAEPTSTVAFEQGAVLTEIQVVSGAWEEVANATQYALTDTLELEKVSGAWGVKTIAPTEMTLSFQSVDSGNNWYFGGTNTDGTYYRVPVIVDGAAQNMIMESNKAGTFTVWNGFFHALQGAEPTSTVTFEQGAVLTEIQVVSGVWEEVANATQYALTDTLELEKVSGAWSIKSNVENSEVSLGAYSWGGGTDGVIGIQIANLAELQSAAWYQSIETANGSSWGKLSGTVSVGSELKTVDIQFPGNGEVFIYYNPTEITESFVISKNTVFIPIIGSANAEKYTVQFTQDYGVDIAEKLVGEPGIGVVYQTLETKNMSVANSLDQTEQARSYIQFTVNQTLLDAGAEWWNNYDTTDASVLIDGAVHEALFGGAGAENALAMYLPWGVDESNLLSNATTITIQSGSKMSVGFNGLKFAEDLTLVKKYGVWMTQADADSFEETTVSLGEYSWSGEGVIGIKLQNLAELQNAAWYQSIVTAETDTWGKLSGTVLADGETKAVDIQFPGNGEIFIYYNSEEVTDSFVLCKSTIFVPITGSANAGRYVIQFTQDYGVNLEENLVGEPGVHVDYSVLDVTKLSVEATGDQAEQKRSYIQFSTEQTLLPAGEEWWNNYDTVNATVLVDGIAHTVAFGGGGASNIFAMYLPWETDESDILANANEIVIKQDAMMSVGLDGLKTNKDLTLSRVGNIWISEYDEEDEKELIPANALKVNVKFGQITGQNILGIQAILSGNQQLLDIYGDWTTAFGSIKLGVLDDSGKMVYTTLESTAYSISDQLYLSAVDLSLYDAILIEADTVLYPDASCKSDRAIVLVNEFAMIRDVDDEWDVLAGTDNTVTDYIGNESGIDTAESVDETNNESTEAVDAGKAEYDGTTLIHRKYADDGTEADVAVNTGLDVQTIMLVSGTVLGVLVLAIIILIVIRKKQQKK